MIVRSLLIITVFSFLAFALYQLLNFIVNKDRFNGKEGKLTRKIKKNVEGISNTTVNLIISIIFIISFLILLMRI